MATDGGDATEIRVERREARDPDGRAGSGHDGLLRGLWHDFQHYDVLNVAAGLAYFAFFSLPPTLLVLFALTGLFGGDEVAEWLTAHLVELLPEDSAGLIEGFVASVVYTEAPGALSIGLLLAIWAGSNVFMSLMRATNLTYDVEDERGFVRQRALAIGVMLLFVLLFLAASAALLAGPEIGQALDPFGVVGAVWTYVYPVLALLVVVLGIAILYFLLPARPQRGHVKEVFAGAAAAAALWLIATLGFRFYVSNFGDYDAMYGFLGGIIVLMLWLYLTAVVLLVGVLLAARLENRGA